MPRKCKSFLNTFQENVGIAQGEMNLDPKIPQKKDQSVILSE